MTSLGDIKFASRSLWRSPGLAAAAIVTLALGIGANGEFGFGLDFSAEGGVRAPGEEDRRARFRVITPGFFAARRVPLVALRAARVDLLQALRAD